MMTIGHDGQGGREREVVREADVVVDDVADEIGARPATDQQRRDEVAEGEREREDRSGDDARQGERQHDAAQRPPVTRTEVGGRLDERVRDPLERAVDRA